MSESVPEAAEKFSVPAPAAECAGVSSTLEATPGLDNRCPVCQARFRGSRICSRCGADLEPLMLLTMKAWQLRESARHALGEGDFDRALQLACEAQGAQDSERGEALRLLAAWLKFR